MLNVKHKETVLRNADDKAYAIDVEVCMYKGPLTMKTVSLNTTEEGDPQDFEVIDWRELYSQNGDIIRVEQELREEHKAHDGVVSS